jgi:bifunctional enzyme CysN/CysC
LTDKSLLRLVTTGSVDDGKSTLIGRLLYETKSVFEDQLDAVAKTSRRKGMTEVDLSLLLDGLSAEREQSITIDVAYRYFETPRRKFIIADTPGHEQYTRNMVTGASTADLAIILIDARSGIQTQSKRHGFLVSLLRVSHLVVAVNKMDLVGYSQEIFDTIVGEYAAFSEKLDIHDIVYIPVSALHGDNIVARSSNMPWYHGFPLLQQLETVQVSADRNLIDFRLPVQGVIRPHQDFRGYSGRIESGAIRPGEEIVVLPSGRSSSVRAIVTYDGQLAEAMAPQSITMTLEDELDISRGDMIVRKNNLPQVSNSFEAIICSMSDSPLSAANPFILKHTTRNTKAFIDKIYYKIDVNTLHRQPASMLALNEIARVRITTSQPLFFDAYAVNRGTGSFVLIDPQSNQTVAGGMIREASRELDAIVASAAPFAGIIQKQSSNVAWEKQSIERVSREARNGHKAAVLWLTGLSGAGKSTIARSVEQKLFSAGCRTMVLDGDNIRHGLCGDLGFSDKDRTENIRRVGEVAKLFFENGAIVICTFISPFKADRAHVRSRMPQDRFFEVFIKCDIEVCKRRDTKKLYQKALSGEIHDFTGISSPYEEPIQPELIAETDLQSVEEITGNIIRMLQTHTIVTTLC